MKKTIKHFFSNHWHTMMLVVMFFINSLEVYQKRNDPEFSSVLGNNIVLMIWVANWYILYLLFKQVKQRADIEEERADIYFEAYTRLYKLIEEHNNKVSKDKS